MNDAGGGGGAGGLGGGGSRIPIPGGGRMGGGIGGIILILLVVTLNYCMGGVGVDGGSGTGGQGSQGQGSQGQGLEPAGGGGAGGDRYGNCETGADANKDVDCARRAVALSLEQYWEKALPSQSETGFEPTSINTFSGAVNTACGQASSQVGPFYCPADMKIYEDTAFYDQVLEQQLGGPDGGFVEPYVLAHEYGHHIQNLLGTMGRVRTQQGPRSDAVRLELQADCYAGMWVSQAADTKDESGVAIFAEITDQDVQQAIDAAAAVGDDRIQQKTQGQVTEESWTHGSAESRMKWFRTGREAGDLTACDTWAVETP